MDIGDKIKLLRDELKMNQVEFAKALSVGQSTISRVEKKQRHPDYSLLKDILDFYNVNPDWLITNLDRQVFLDYDENNISTKNISIIKDINSISSDEEFSEELTQILINKMINLLTLIVDIDKESLRSFFSSVKSENHFPFRPLLFLYYILKYVELNPQELEAAKAFKKYFKYLIQNYKPNSITRSPFFNNKIKDQYLASAELYLNEDICKQILTNYPRILKAIESKMSPEVVLGHRSFNYSSLISK